MSRKFQIKTVPSTWLENNGRRLDCGPYMSGALEAKEYLRKHNTEPLKRVTSDIYHAGRESRIWIDSPEHGIPFMGSTDILSMDLTSLPLISKKQVLSNPRFSITKGWTLITRSGTVGRMAFARSDMDGVACSEHVLRVVPNEDHIKPGYLYAYLSSRFGVPIVVSGTYGAIIQHIEPDHVCDLPVPRLGDIEEQAHDLIERASELRVDAAKQIQDASTKYLAAAGISEISSYDWISNSGRAGFTAKISRNILRAVNYIPLNQELAETVKNSSPSWKPLGELTIPGTLRRGLRFKRVDAEPEYGVRLVGQREGFHLVPEGRFIAKSHLPNDPLIYVPEGTIVIASQGGINETDSFARAQFMYGKRLDYVYSEHFLRVIADETKIPRGALFAFIRSNIAFRLLRACAVGSMQQDFHPDLLAEIPVPIVSDDESMAIDLLVRDSFQKYDDAIDCEDQARTLVERAIEEGGR
jgi:hypothetical protein